LLNTHELITFSTLFNEDVSRLNVLTTFLALLEIVKLQLVRIYQDRPFGTILITRRVPLKDGEIAELDWITTPDVSRT
jgi:segregation and condensation protein A